MVGACRAPPISHLPPWNPKTPSSLSRRVFLLSLPLSSAFLQSSSYAASTVYDPVSPSEKDASTLISLRVSEAVNLLEKGKELQARGDFNGSLDCFSKVIENYKDLAFSEYARVGRALALYEVGDREEAIAEMEDVSISLKGYPEVHAALAAALYADKHAPLLAENQFTIATLLDPHFTDLSYVRDTKHWPPSLISSLKHFITLS
ncbi:hypothetical protein HN51_012833 [Arachis hypogaea]|uniref:uncharacterized protein n=1 Tax=Arachis hypogaea TaxID=3818 RepID=UPI000DEC41AA|nr:uncharacterized protein LOC112791110 [Arachis hypogaea]QHO58424.1 uncharacterized protein DS421_3g90470 [Arachis hypogaea]